MKTITFLVGKSGVGKSFIAKELSEIQFLKNKCEIFSFAKPIKDFLNHGVSKEGSDRLLNTFFKKDKQELRTAMQQLGDFGRNLDKEFFVNKMVSRIKNSQKDFILIDDVRYINEIKKTIEFLEKGKENKYENGYLVVNIRDNWEIKEVDKNNHSSELEYEKIFLDFNNIFQSELENLLFWDFNFFNVNLKIGEFENFMDVLSRQIERVNDFLINQNEDAFDTSNKNEI